MKISFFLKTVILAAILSGCMGGGTFGTGVEVGNSFGQGSGRGSESFSRLNIHGRISGPGGAALANAAVLIGNDRDSAESTVTGKNGSYSLETAFDSNEPLWLWLDSGKTHAAYQLDKLMTVAAETLELNLTLGRDGQLRPAAHR